MKASEILEMIQDGENSGVEFKRDDVRPEQLAREVVAIANFRGGRIFLGVEDDGTISGIQRPGLEEWVMDTVFGAKVHPMILPFYEEVLFNDGKRVAAVTFPEGTSKPYVLRHEGREEIYIRVGSTSRRATREQQARLHQAGGILHTEQLPVSGTSFNSLDRSRLEDYLRNITQDAELPVDDDAWARRLTGLGFMTESADTHLCTIAGLVLFGRSPRRALRQAGVRLMVFDGKEKDYGAKLDEILDAPLAALWVEARNGKREFSEGGLVERVVALLKPFITREASEVNEGFRLDTISLYPMEAVREVLINALAHRDWTRATDIELVVYSDRLELTSPGPLPNRMTIEKMIAGQRSPRNPIIVDVLRDYGYVDARGMGVRNKIIPHVRQATGKDPIFEETDDYLRTTLPAAEVHE